MNSVDIFEPKLLTILELARMLGKVRHTQNLQITWLLQFSACFYAAQLAFPLSDQDSTQYHSTLLPPTSLGHSTMPGDYHYPCIWRVVKVEPINEERVRWADRGQIWSHHEPTHNPGEKVQVFIRWPFFYVFTTQKVWHFWVDIVVSNWQTG